MTSRRLLIWVGAIGAGGCLTLAAATGVAAADSDSESADSASSSTEQDSSAASQDSPDGGTTEGSGTATDPATIPASIKPSVIRSAEDDADEEAQADAALEDAIELEIEDLSSAGEESTEGLEVESTDAEIDGTDGETTETTEVPDSVLSDTDPVTPSTEVAEAASDDAVTPPTGRAAAVPDEVAEADSESADAAPAVLQAAAAGPVTGVQTGRATLTIPLDDDEFRTRADWYFPTQADGSIAATGVIWLQHGFLGTKSSYSALAKTLAQQTNSVVVAANLPSFPSLRCGGCWINGTALQQGVAAMFVGGEDSLNMSATAAGLVGTLPTSFVLSGHSAGGGFATAAGGYYAADPSSGGNLRGVVMFDGFSFSGVVPDALQRLDNPYIPVYQIAAPPQPFNSNGATTAELVAARPGQFVGVTLANGSHVDSMLGSNPIIDFFAQLVTRFSPAGNTEAVYTLATGWINDLYQGLGPADGTGIYGAPDQYIVMGDTAAVVLSPPPVVDLDRYLGTWYEVGSVKQFFSIGLVNTTAQYSLNPDGSIRVENSGNYFVNNGPESRIVGAALPVEGSENKLNVAFFFGNPSTNPPGNYWIVDLDPDYQWAIVTDFTGLSGFLLTRTRTVSDDFYQELLNRASVKGVKGRITPTRQPAADTVTV
ncbi:lipocalin family protein [uncultured Mycolicibacterium sp.]|uniref:lipocalin family protein n=1 Tax=uncultured Mycolicibacterium sp. TaxID=2320817 RepID=UPI0032B2EDAC